jgi:cyclopropane-fatty-acyl-phospholipid synthase
VPSLSEVVKSIENNGLIISDVESLIHHYDKTLKAWLDRFLESKRRVRQLYDDKFVRMWTFYLASTSAAFKFRDLVVYQFQLVKDFKAIPSNRRDYIYS